VYENDPLWKMRHALIGLVLALLLSVLIAAGIGRLVGDVSGGDYGTRLTVYLVLLAYVVAGTVVLFIKVARHETQPVNPGRVLKWVLSLWLWPLLLFLRAR